MSPMYVRAANTLMRPCICPGSSEFSMLAYKQISLSYYLAFQKVFCDFVPKEDAISRLKKKMPILVRYQSTFYTN